MRKENFSVRVVSTLVFMAMMLSGCEANANSPNSKYIYKLPVISDLTTKTSFNKRIFSEGKTVSLSLSHQASGSNPYHGIYNSHGPSYVERVFLESSEAMTAFLRSKGVSSRDCRGPSYNLNIFIVKRDVLQSNERFRDFYIKRFGKPKIDGHTLYGYYDSTPQIKNHSTILLTNVTPYINKEVLAHELAHYWWDRLCLANSFSYTAESFAQEFDLFFMRRYSN